MNARSSAKIETDFGGFSTAVLGNFTTLRIRHAYIKLDWEHASLLAGQTWHPLFGDVLPNIINLNTGSPFQLLTGVLSFSIIINSASLICVRLPFSRISTVQADQRGAKVMDYSRDAVLPELYAGIDYRSKGLLAGVGVDMLTLAPRTQSTKGNLTYKISERNVSASVTAFASYARVVEAER